AALVGKLFVRFLRLVLALFELLSLRRDFFFGSAFLLEILELGALGGLFALGLTFLLDQLPLLLARFLFIELEVLVLFGLGAGLAAAFRLLSLDVRLLGLGVRPGRLALASGQCLLGFLLGRLLGLLRPRALDLSGQRIPRALGRTDGLSGPLVDVVV